MLNTKYILVKINLKESQTVILVSLSLFKIVLGGLKMQFFYIFYVYLLHIIYDI